MDKRTNSGIHLVKPVQAVYSPNGQLLATNQEPEVPKPELLPEDRTQLKKGIMYLIDDWVINGHRLNIVGVYDDRGNLQGGLFIADHDGNPHSLVKPEEEKGVLFHRLCELLDVETEIK